MIGFRPLAQSFPAGDAVAVSFGPFPVGTLIKRACIVYTSSDLLAFNAFASHRPIVAADTPDTARPLFGAGVSIPTNATIPVAFELPLNLRVTDTEAYLGFTAAAATLTLVMTVALEVEVPVAAVEPEAPIGLEV